MVPVPFSRLSTSAFIPYSSTYSLSSSTNASSTICNVAKKLTAVVPYTDFRRGRRASSPPSSVPFVSEGILIMAKQPFVYPILSSDTPSTASILSLNSSVMTGVLSSQSYDAYPASRSMFVKVLISKSCRSSILFVISVPLLMTTAPSAQIHPMLRDSRVTANLLPERVIFRHAIPAMDAPSLQCFLLPRLCRILLRGCRVRL